jgi:hypothetical protein
MDATGDFAWLSLLQRRADYARKAAIGARTPNIAKELSELAALYDDIAGRAEVESARPAVGGIDRRVARGNVQDELVRHLLSRSHDFLAKARTLTDKGRAEELKYLAGVYGAEAARLKTDRMR